ncbi:MAG: hypothetical protein ITG02_02050 [Patulibacter sp.]|nr:hypothetical protein [Patulibacter sp.]
MRLIASSTPAEADLAALHELLTFYGSVLETTSERVRSGLAIKTTSRLKNTGTILEKLRRSGGATLKSMQDLAGMRIVGGPDRKEQDETVERVVALFEGETRQPKVIDRRANPVHGYSAVHVIVFPEGVPVEIQVRTAWQHEWAEVFEKLADAVGRGIRYGEEPERLETSTLPDASGLPIDIPKFNRSVVNATESDYRQRTGAVESARLVARIIALHELSAADGISGLDIDGSLDEDLRDLHDWVERLHATGTRWNLIHATIERVRSRLACAPDESA